MQNLAMTVLDFYWEIVFADEDYCEIDWSLKVAERIKEDIEGRYTAEEQSAIKAAASFRLAEVREQNKKLPAGRRPQFDTNEISFLEAIADGDFGGE